jgi:hypothetical protein
MGSTPPTTKEWLGRTPSQNYSPSGRISANRSLRTFHIRKETRKETREKTRKKIIEILRDMSMGQRMLFLP